MIATDLLEYLTKDEVLDTLDAVIRALAPGGAFVARVPNAASPLGGHVRYGDFTHESFYTARSVGQITAAAGFSVPSRSKRNAARVVRVSSPGRS